MPCSREQIAEACRETVRANRLRECYLRPIAFLGDGEMGLSARPPTRVAIAAWPWGAYLGDDGLQNGVRLKTSSFQRFHPEHPAHQGEGGRTLRQLDPRGAGSARGGGYDEALLLDVDGYVSEASGENIFIVQQGVVKTTPLPTVLGGITRDAALRLLADLGVAIARGAVHARRGLPRRRGVLHRHRRRDHARSASSTGAASARDVPGR